MPSSYVVPGAPEVLDYDYMQWIVGFTNSSANALATASALNSVHLGAGGCALPSFFAHRWGGRTTAVEKDTALAKLVRQVFDPPVSIKTADARTFAHALPPASVHVIVRDVFAGPSTPSGLTTVEFYQAVHRALRPGGLFVANVGGLPGTFRNSCGIGGLTRDFPLHCRRRPSSAAYGSRIRQCRHCCLRRAASFQPSSRRPEIKHHAPRDLPGRRRLPQRCGSQARPPATPLAHNHTSDGSQMMRAGQIPQHFDPGLARP